MGIDALTGVYLGAALTEIEREANTSRISPVKQRWARQTRTDEAVDTNSLCEWRPLETAGCSLVTTI